MNLFQAIYCNQYEELTRTGRAGDKAHKNGIIIITVSIVINLFTLALILLSLGKAGFLNHYMHRAVDITGSGRSAGKLIAAVLMLVAGALVWVTFGRKAYYYKTIADFNALPPEYQKRTARRGAVYFLGSIGLFIVLLFGSALIGHH